MITPANTEFEIEEGKYFNPIAESLKTHKLCVTITPFNIKKKVSVISHELYLKNQAVGNYMLCLYIILTVMWY